MFSCASFEKSIISTETFSVSILQIPRVTPPLSDNVFFNTNPAIHADETHVLVRKDGREAGSKSYMWVYRTGEKEKKAVILYEYQKTRKADHPERFLKDYKGICVTDGYQVYHKLGEEKEGLTIAGCWAHARRRYIYEPL